MRDFEYIQYRGGRVKAGGTGRYACGSAVPESLPTSRRRS